MQNEFNQINAYLLMGGRSRRLGQDKRLITMQGQPLWRRTAALIKEALGRKPILVGDDLSSEVFGGYSVLRDAIPKTGPLGGLVSVLRDCSTPWALVLAVDLPLLEHSDLQRLLSARRGGFDVITLSTDGQMEPLAALYRKPTLDFWEKRLARNDLSLHEGIEQLVWKVVRLPKGSRALLNLNEPGDLEGI